MNVDIKLCYIDMYRSCLMFYPQPCLFFVCSSAVQCMGLVFACCICVQVVYIAELKQSVSASSSSRCSWLHLLRPLLINSGRTRLCILDPEIHLVAGREILRCEVVRGCPHFVLRWCLHLCHMISWFFNKLYYEVIYLALGDEVALC
jgi:hypothetical protein